MTKKTNNENLQEKHEEIYSYSYIDETNWQIPWEFEKIIEVTEWYTTYKRIVPMTEEEKKEKEYEINKKIIEEKILEIKIKIINWEATEEDLKILDLLVK